MQLRAWLMADCSPAGELLERQICCWMFNNQPCAFSIKPYPGSKQGQLTCRLLQVRLKAVNRSVGEVARKLLEVSEREPPIRRDHWQDS